ncbi:MAG: ATP-grasp domain-containing protein [Prevotella sp.]|nr:ATP-grasp domain-containing protein [Prevotella sp.]
MKILILGAGIYQVPLIKKAKEMGLYTIVCSIEGNYPGFAFADQVYYVNTTDIEGCLSVAEREQIDGVCTTGTDVALPALGAIVDRFNLKGPSYKSAVLSADKREMKDAFVRSGVSTANFRKIESSIEGLSAAEEIGYPVILKVTDNSGSRGICVVRDRSEFENAYHSVLPYTKKAYILVEKYLEGHEYGAQALVSNGRVLFVMPHGDIVFQGKTGVPVGHYVPYKISSELEKDTVSQVERAIKALGIDNAAVNADLIECNGRAYVLEIGARVGATCLPEIVSQYYGIDYYEMILKISLGLAFEEKFIPQCACVAELITSEIDGVIKKYNTNIIHPNLLQYSMDYPVGFKVKRFSVGPDRIGQVITFGKTLEDSQKFMSEIMKSIELIVE